MSASARATAEAPSQWLAGCADTPARHTQGDLANSRNG